MNVLIQIVCFLISYVYGVFINIFIRFNNKIIKNNSLLWEIIYRLVSTFLLVVLYVVIFYKINGGIFHLYFILLIIIGYMMGNKIKFKNVNKECKV